MYTGLRLNNLTMSTESHEKVWLVLEGRGVQPEATISISMSQLEEVVETVSQARGDDFRAFVDLGDAGRVRVHTGITGSLVLTFYHQRYPECKSVFIGTQIPVVINAMRVLLTKRKTRTMKEFISDLLL